MKKHGVIIDMINNSLTFWPSHCRHIWATSLIILSSPSLHIEIAVVRIEKAIIHQKMIKKSSKEDMTDFLQMPNKLFSKKRRPINKSKQKANIGKISSRKATINSLDSFDKKELLVLLAAIKSLEPKAKDIDIAKISTDAYYVACHWKRA